MRDHRLERHEALPGGDEPVEPFRHLDAGESLLGRVRVDGEHAQRERQPGDVREWLARADRERRQDRVDVARVHRLEALQLLRRALLDRDDLDTLGGERRLQLALPELRLPSRQLRDACLDARERLGGGEAVGGALGKSCRLLIEEAGDAHHEELVQVRREDGAELDPLEQRLRLVPGEVEDARVELDPRQLAVEKPIFGCEVAGRHQVNRA